MVVLDQLRDGQAFGRYQIVRLIGEGGMGAVYEAVHPVLKKRFAIKTLLASVAQTPGVRARFLREGEAASRINHPNVVDVVDVGVEDGTPYLVMELLEGETLHAFIARRRQLGVAEAADILLPVISAVAAGHAEGVIHRDLKPQNVFLARGRGSPEPTPKVLDFGVSKLTDEDDSFIRTGTTVVLGTLAYMSPEQARGARRVDGQSDQYALGLILYEMLGGARAHTGENMLEILHNIANNPVPPLGEVRRDLPRELERLTMRMLARAPGDRWPSLNVVGRMLLPFASGKVRIAMGDGFRDTTPAVVRPTGSAAAPAAPAGDGAAEPAPAGGRGPGSVATAALAAPVKQMPTTLVQPLPSRAPVASDSPTTASTPPRPRPGAKIALGVAAALAVAVVVMLVMPRSPLSPPASPSPSPSSSSSSSSSSKASPPDMPRAEPPTPPPPPAGPLPAEGDAPAAAAAPAPPPPPEVRLQPASERPAGPRPKKRRGRPAVAVERPSPSPSPAPAAPPATSPPAAARPGEAIEPPPPPPPRRGTNDALIIR